MGKVYTGASMSLDGYIAGPEESGFDKLFTWYGDGDVEVETAVPGWTLKMRPDNATYWRWVLDNVGCLLVGRRLFDLMNAWNGTHPAGTPVVVLTHVPPEDYPRGGTDFHFVTEGIEAAIAKAQELAGDKAVGVNGGQMSSQALEAGLLDEVHVGLVPVLLGGGVPFFPGLGKAPLDLEGPEVIATTPSITHLRYTVPKAQARV
jgi:dihydrofolate reductase